MDSRPSCFEFLPTSHAGKLRVGLWSPQATGLRGTILLLSGRTEFMEKYTETIRELNERGFMVCSFDWSGQGLSSRMLTDRHKGHISTFESYLDDMALVVQKVVLPRTQPPFMVLGALHGRPFGPALYF